MLALQIDWVPVAAVVAIGVSLIVLLRLTEWHAHRRARAHTSALLKRFAAKDRE